MPHDEKLAKRVRDELARRKVSCEEKAMMGGICFMVADKMCVGVEKDRLMVRIDPAIYEISLARKGCVPMDFTGRPMRGFVFVNPIGLASADELAHWLNLALEFNPRAKASKKKTAEKSPASERTRARV